MSWEEIDKLLVKMFDSQLRKLKNRQTRFEESYPKNESPTSDFKGWLAEFIRDCSEYEEFEKSRLKCKFCSDKIVDANFVVIFHPDYPEDYTKQLYFHSTDQCSPRMRFLEITRKMWLIRYQLEGKLKNP